MKYIRVAESVDAIKFDGTIKHADELGISIMQSPTYGNDVRFSFRGVGGREEIKAGEYLVTSEDGRYKCDEDYLMKRFYSWEKLEKELDSMTHDNLEDYMNKDIYECSCPRCNGTGKIKVCPLCNNKGVVSNSSENNTYSVSPCPNGCEGPRAML